MSKSPRANILTIIGPGILVAATGVGAGDLSTGAIVGSKLGVTVLWAVLVGALLKYVLTEGLTRWQLVTHDTILEGCARNFGRWALWAFLSYLIVWSFMVGSALMSACGATAHAILPIFDVATTKDAAHINKIIYGIAHSLVAVILVRIGGYQLFEKIMSVCVGIMFVIVLATAAAMKPNLTAITTGLLVPQVPIDGSFVDALRNTIALMGGVGGTVTILCYGYWIREEKREGADFINPCRIDLATGYVMTALFGVSMVIIGSRIAMPEGKGAQLMVMLADQLRASFGEYGGAARAAFLFGAWGAVFSSLLGVWQSVPYLFADLRDLMARELTEPNTNRLKIDTGSKAYQNYLWGLGIVPVIGLFFDFVAIQMVNAVIGALFIPMLAAALLVLNGRASVMNSYKNSWLTSSLLSATLIFFSIFGVMEIVKKVF